MVSVVYVVGTPACEAGGEGSTPFGHPLERTHELLIKFEIAVDYVVSVGQTSMSLGCFVANDVA